MKITVEIVFALPREQKVVRIELDDDATVEEAVKRSGLLEQYPELDTAGWPLGVWGRAVARSQVLRDRDRIEIYRPLIADPKQVRRKRAEAERKRRLRPPR